MQHAIYSFKIIEACRVDNLISRSVKISDVVWFIDSSTFAC